MIKNRHLLESFEISLAGRDAVDYRRNFEIYQALYQQARTLGIFPLENPLDGIDSDIHLARILNVRKTS